MKKFLKLALRAGSLNFAKSAMQTTPTGAVGQVKYQGKPVHFREGTSDALVVYEILFKGRRSEYWDARMPAPDDVEVILDIGGNIGAATVFFSERYPAAKIHTFEPIPGNFSILEKNAGSRARPGSIQCHALALSDKDGELEMIHSPSMANNGGWSFYQRGAAGSEEKVSVPVRRSGDFIRSLGLARIDIIKIDTEGAEKEILFGLDPKQLATVKYIVGELHGERDFELLDWLECHGFDIECKKSFGKPLFVFKARRVKEIFAEL
ncbi:MAG: FkbM family methyltransferase [Sulfuritalea sp.]|jgi:FkbM family methyltransferase|nr:FkbM family methyltransferase [Sulfuritalea sp.]